MYSDQYLTYYVAGLLALIFVLALICIMYVPIREMFSNGSSGKQLEYYSLSTCPHCVDFNPVWKQFEEKCSGCKKYVVDTDEASAMQAEKYNINGFPTIIVTENGKQIDEVEDRTCGALRDMCKKHGIPCTVVC